MLSTLSVIAVLPFPGFIYWGVFLVCGAIWIAYAIWMRGENARDAPETIEDPEEPRR